MQHENKALFGQVGYLKLDLEESEAKVEAFKKEKEVAEAKLDEEFAENEVHRKDIKAASVLKIDLEKEILKLYTENKALMAKNKEQHKKFLDKSDFHDILENTLDNKVLEIDRLRQKIEMLRKSQFACAYCDYETAVEDNLKGHVRVNHESQFPCKSCDQKSDIESDLCKHTQEKHDNGVEHSLQNCDLATTSKSDLKDLSDVYEHKCTLCNYTCKTELKLKNHICKIDIQNPTFGDFYMKNWIVANKCSPIFSSKRKRNCFIALC